MIQCCTAFFEAGSGYIGNIIRGILLMKLTRRSIAILTLTILIPTFYVNANDNLILKLNLQESTQSNTWIQIPNTQLKNTVGPESYEQPIRGIIGPRGIVDAWNGAVWNENEQHLDIIAAGGHGDYCGNEYYRFDLDDQTWTQVVPPSDLQGYDEQSGITPDGRPASRHTYQQQVFVPKTNKTYMFGGSICSGSGHGDNKIWSFSPNGKHELLGAIKGYASLGGHALYDSISNLIFLVKRGHVYQFDIATNEMLDLTKKEADWDWGTSAAIDVERRIIFAFGHRHSWIFNLKSGTKQKISPTGDFTLINRKGVGMVFVKSIDRYVIWSGGNILYFVNPETFNFVPMNTDGTAPKENINGVYGRFQYSEKYGGFIVVSQYNEDVFFLKLEIYPKKSENKGVGPNGT